LGSTKETFLHIMMADGWHMASGRLVAWAPERLGSDVSHVCQDKVSGYDQRRDQTAILPFLLSTTARSPASVVAAAALLPSLTST